MKEEKTRSERIREISGLSRATFCKKYNIPIRTVEDWDWGKKIPSEWVLDLLERVVMEDFQSNI
jgi:putative transcriptional regulator